MLQKFYPKKYVKSLKDINFFNLFDEGFTGIIFDIDNTLAEHGKSIKEEYFQLIQQLKDIGFKIIILSNNTEQRVSQFAKNIGVPYISKAKKPFALNYLKACEKLNIKKEQAIFIGDQIFTDILGANNAEIFSILVKPINHKEEIQILFKRLFEKIILYYYKKNIKR